MYKYEVLSSKSKNSREYLGAIVGECLQSWSSYRKVLGRHTRVCARLWTMTHAVISIRRENPVPNKENRVDN